MSVRDVGQKLRRLLFVVPYVAKHPEGVLVEDLAKRLGVDRDEMVADLDLLTQVGPPDGDPGEYLLVTVEDGRVFVELAHRLTRPLRLTPAEGCSLLLGVRALRQSGVAPYDAAMESAERKLLAAKGGIRLVRGDRLRARIHDELDAIEAHYLAAPAVDEVAPHNGEAGAPEGEAGDA